MWKESLDISWGILWCSLLIAYLLRINVELTPKFAFALGLAGVAGTFAYAGIKWLIWG